MCVGPGEPLHPASPGTPATQPGLLLGPEERASAKGKPLKFFAGIFQIRPGETRAIAISLSKSQTQKIMRAQGWSQWVSDPSALSWTLQGPQGGPQSVWMLCGREQVLSAPRAALRDVGQWL